MKFTIYNGETHFKQLFRLINETEEALQKNERY